MGGSEFVVPGLGLGRRVLPSLGGFACRTSAGAKRKRAAEGGLEANERSGYRVTRVTISGPLSQTMIVCS